MKKSRLIIVITASVIAVVGLVGLAACLGGCQAGGGCPMHAMTGGAAAAPHADAADKTPASIVNARCPIMGGKATETLTRDYKGQKVGFCCGGCPGTWDKLSDADKDAKLAKVVATAK